MTRERKKQQKRDAILKAAHAEFTARRFDEVKLDDIAARAGVGKGTLYLYFENKEDLFVQMAIDGVAEMSERMREIAAMNISFHERFLCFGREVAVFIERRSVMFRLMNQTGSEIIQKAFMQQHKQLVRAARSLIQAGIDERALRDDFTVADLHCSLIGPLLFRSRLNRFNHDNIEVESLLELFWSAAAVRR
ncbi:TetR/AcrR family transcriptional regulator [Tichowtungia aerotolerans]|uniref:TetR family transcriptional regulator n=1 Tax=Tichowtungia aerotolerans TaxID=2697043 RepID=A0A6P1M4U4_9BACT|nr:TetR/AcrR family transcriptional regulator [Tichowtungia aerotolerans]QHI68023.1 TetR family transcriptional regulator [Tichowtungia aerotolerans]